MKTEMDIPTALKLTVTSYKISFQNFQKSFDGEWRIWSRSFTLGESMKLPKSKRFTLTHIWMQSKKFSPGLAK